MQHLKHILLFALACALGAWSRYFIMQTLTYSVDFGSLWSTFIINIVGCFGFGLLWEISKGRKIILTGFMGSFTTFSSYVFEIYLFVGSKDWLLLISNGLMQIILGIIALCMGMHLYEKLAK